jgi:hypothetical protein
MVLNGEKVPVNWKQAVVVPDLKEGKNDRLYCYRPVSLSTLASKIADELAYSTLSNLTQYAE